LDEIRRRLAEIDRQLDRSPSNYHKQIVTTAPLLFCAAGMMAGIVIQNNLPIPVWIWLLVAFCTAISAALLVVRQSWLVREANRSYIIPYLALVCFACVGAIRLANLNQPKPNDIRNFVGDEQMLATVRGIIETEPYIEKRNWQFAKFKYSDPASSFYLRVIEAEMVTGWTKIAGLVRVRVNEPVMDLKAGDNIQIYCWLDRFKNATNPGEFNIKKYIARKGVFVGASVESREAIELLEGGSTGLFVKTKAGLRKIAMEALLGGPHPEDESEKLLLALILGHRAEIDAETLEAFRQTGLLHFICLSGMNFAMVIGFVWWVCKTAGLMKPARAIVCMLSAILFLLVVPENAPAFRAAVMCFAFCGAFIFRRKSNPFNSLALAAIVLLLIRPTGLFEADWQLSFVSVLGIMALWPRFYPILREKTIDHPWFTDFMKARPFLPRILANPWPYSIFSTSFTAWLSIAGIMLYHFYTIQWLTSIWTVLVSPLIGVVSILGYLKLIVALFSPSVGAILGVIVNVLADLLIYIVKLIADLNISEILVGKTNTWAIILYYALIMYIFFFHLRQRMTKKAVYTTAIAVLVVMVALPKWQRTHRDHLSVTVLDVGHGQAVLAELPGKINMLFDAGSLSRDDVGTRVVLPFLRYSGIGKIDAVVISHGDIDHINGIPEVTGDFRVKYVYASKASFEDKRQTTEFLRDDLLQKAIAMREINDFPLEFGPTRISVLWPDITISENNMVSDNDKSIVTLIEYAGRRVLICSDIEKFAQEEILRLYPDLKADVLIAPHHGSTRTVERNFLDKTGPNAVISSCTRTAYEKGQVIRQDSNPCLYYTGRDGAIKVYIDRNGTIQIDKFTKEK
jgi:competence protein ComEC